MRGTTPLPPLSMSLHKCKSHICLLVGPPLEQDSISSVAKKKSKGDIFDEMPIFSHWFALALYEVYLQAKQQLSTQVDELTLKIENNSYKIPRDLLTKASDIIRNAATMKDEDEEELSGIRASKSLCQSEPSYSMLVSSALDKLCFGLSFDASIEHQGPVRKKRRTSGNPDTADMLGFRLVMRKIMETFFVSDLKLSDLDISVKESALYGKFASMKKDRKGCNLVIGLAATCSTASLWLYVMAKKKLWAIPILKYFTPWDHVVLATLCTGLRFLAKNPLHYSVIKHPTPFKEDHLQPLKTGLKNRTYLTNENEVLKIFDDQDEVVKGNTDILILAGVNATTNIISTDKSPYSKGNHSPTNLCQFRGIIAMLNNLHSKGYVHGDIRLSNLVFDNTGNSGYLIDYDLSREMSPNSVYPPGYLEDKIRHDHAKTGNLMCHSHDRHSFSIIISECFRNDPAASKLSKMLQSDMTLESILQEWPTDQQFGVHT